VNARAYSLKLFDAFQARISYMIAATSMSKSTKKESDFRFFKDSGPRHRNLLNKWLTIVNAFNMRQQIKKALDD